MKHIRKFPYLLSAGLALSAIAACGSSADQASIDTVASVTVEPTVPVAATEVAVTVSAADTMPPAPAGQLLGGDVTTAEEVSASLAEEVSGTCENVETQQKCLFYPSAAASPVEELMVDCNSLFSFANPSPRMAEFTDDPTPIEGIAAAARFRTMTAPTIKAEFEIELAKGPTTMCSVQLILKEGDPASYQAQLTTIAAAVAGRLS